MEKSKVTNKKKLPSPHRVRYFNKSLNYNDPQNHERSYCLISSVKLCLKNLHLIF